MAATTIVVVFHEAGPSAHPLDQTDSFVDTLGHIRFKQADNSNKDTNNPIPIPAVAQPHNYSYLKSTKLIFTTVPPIKITNLRWFSDGAEIDSAKVVVHCGYAAGYTQGSSSDITTNRISSLGFTTGASGTPSTYYVDGSELTLTAGDVLTAPSTGYGTQDYLYQQMEVKPGATSGPTADKTYTYRYDEQ